MLKRAITYESFDGETVTEDFYFHISKAELAELELGKSKDGGMDGWIKRMIKDKDGSAVVEELRKIILMSVGEKSEDGRRFRKTQEIRDDFLSSPAYEVIFMELATDAKKTAAFIAAAIPGDLSADDLEAEINRNVFTEPQPTAEETGEERVQDPPKDPTALDGSGAAVPRKVYTRKELMAMSEGEYAEAQKQIATGEADYTDGIPQ